VRYYSKEGQKERNGKTGEKRGREKGHIRMVQKNQVMDVYVL